MVTTVVLIMSLTSCNGTFGENQDRPELLPSTSEWTEFGNNPVIKYNDVLDGILWNDPSVIKEGSKYRMWLTGGKPFDVPIVVKVYEAHSDDGIDWNISPSPVLEPGEAGAWDDLRTETPSVIRVGDTFHLYYSGCNSPCTDGKYDIGHATSEDGTHWVKDPRNPVIADQPDPLKWGFYTVGEPAIVHHEDTYYLYYSSAKSNYPEYGSPFGILLATSKDGSNFQQRGAVYTLTPTYDPELFRGYSTPEVYVADGVFHLYHDVVYSPGNPDGFEQVAISHAISEDGLTFIESDTNIIAVDEDWKRVSVNGPAVLDDGGTTKMWFAGRTDKPGFGFGIGYATKPSGLE